MDIDDVDNAAMVFAQLGGGRLRQERGALRWAEQRVPPFGDSRFGRKKLDALLIRISRLRN